MLFVHSCSGKSWTHPGSCLLLVEKLDNVAQNHDFITQSSSDLLIYSGMNRPPVNV